MPSPSSIPMHRTPSISLGPVFLSFGGTSWNNLATKASLSANSPNEPNCRSVRGALIHFPRQLDEGLRLPLRRLLLPPECLRRLGVDGLSDHDERNAGTPPTVTDPAVAFCPYRMSIETDSPSDTTVPLSRRVSAGLSAASARFTIVRAGSAASCATVGVDEVAGGVGLGLEELVAVGSSESPHELRAR